MALQILLADDHVVVRQGLRALLEEEGFEVVGEARDGLEAVGLVEKLRPTIAVLDVAMPKLNGIDAARQIKKISSQTRTILLTALTEDRYVLESLRAGIRGYVLKASSGDELVEAIREVARGKVYLSPGLSSTVVEAYIADLKVSERELTDREREVLQLIAEGKTTKEIAATLNVTFKTAESHRANIMQKLEIHDIAGLVRYAIRHGLIQP